jgi:hypothetical protein
MLSVGQAERSTSSLAMAFLPTGLDSALSLLKAADKHRWRREREIPGGLQATTDLNGGGRPDSLII